MIFADFKECIDTMVFIHNRSLQAYKLNIDLVEYGDPYDKIMSILWENILTEDGYEWLSWYLYDKDGISGNPRDDIKAYDNDVEICKNLEDLHSYLVKNNYLNLNKENKDD